MAATQCPLPGKSHGQRTWWIAVHGVGKSWATERLTQHIINNGPHLLLLLIHIFLFQTMLGFFNVNFYFWIKLFET